MYALRAALATFALAAIACAAAGAYPSTLQVKLYAQNRPGETGTATFEQVPNGVKSSSGWPVTATAESPFTSMKELQETEPGTQISPQRPPSWNQHDDNTEHHHRRSAQGQLCN